MKNNKRFAIALVFVLLIVLTVSGVQAQDITPTSGALADESVFLPFVPNIQFAPLYVAQAKGYFADAGFNVSFEYGDEPNGLELIAAGQRHFGTISGEQVIQARANGRPVVFVYEWYQKYPIGIATPENSGINSVADLKGHKVGIPGRFGASYTGLTALLAANGMTENDINLQEIGFNAADVVCVGGVDAAVVYINNEPLQIDDRAKAGNCGSVTGVKVFSVSDSVDIVSNGLVTNEDMVTNHPDQVQGLVAAFDKGLRETIDNPAVAYLASADVVENLIPSDDFRAALQTEASAQADFLAANPTADRQAMAAQRAAILDHLSAKFDAATMTQFEVLLNTIDLWDTDQLGYTDPASWDTTQQTLVNMGFVQTPIDLSKAFTNNFLPANG
jgi:putative riboflavin transport system substrate-binding protein